MSNIQGFRGGKIAEGRAMWESPITQVSTQLEQKMREEEDKLVIEVSQIIGYDINKEELIKALNYSQEQFAKGYDKGYKKAMEELTGQPQKEIGCYTCPNVGHADKPDCDSAYSANAKYCNLYNHSTWEEKE